MTLEGTEVADLETEAGEAEDLEGASSSSLDLRSNEISTVEVVTVFVGGEYLKSKRGWGASTGLSTCASLNNGVRLQANSGDLVVLGCLLSVCYELNFVMTGADVCLRDLNETQGRTWRGI